MRQGQKIKTMKQQIFSGYLCVIWLTLLLVASTLFCLLSIRHDYDQLSGYQRNQADTKDAIVGHYEWLEALNASLETNVDFTGSLDSNTCSLGNWRGGLSQKDLDDRLISSRLSAISAPHEEIHSMAAPLIELSKTDRSAALAQYVTEVKPRVDQVIAGLTDITGRYEELAQAEADSFERFIVLSVMICVVMACIVIFVSVNFAQRVAGRISGPIAAVAEWSKKLSLGIEDLDFTSNAQEKNNCQEIEMMVESFEKMAASIQENVSVVQRVANGDMTAFVNIRSSQDSLGKNLYRMVQSNDLLFAEILQIASSVAQASGNISESSQSMAEMASTQAQAVSALSATIDEANGLIGRTTEKTGQAEEISRGIEVDMQMSGEKMQRLVESVDGIRAASERISTVIKSIDDIAFQTNILALNASVEAARAGAAGKGFAVVADEVRSLANKSQEAAQESRALIEDTISRTHEGSGLAQDTSSTFTRTIEDIHRIVELVYEISNFCGKQLEGISEIRTGIGKITEAATGYAAVSEESAAASQEMNGNAELLRQAMSKFNLRKRQQGQAYIPPEKENDLEFVRQANENYRKALETGRLGEFEYISSGE